MSNTVKHGTSGSIPLTGKGGDKPIYSLNQLAYLLPRYDKVKRIYRFLKSVHNHFVNQSNYFSLRKICEAHNISFHVIGVLKKMKVITNDKWIYTGPTYLPNWALAIKVEIAYKEIQADVSIPLTGKDGDKPIYTLNQLAYLLPRYDKVERTYSFLKAVHNHFVNQSSYFSLKKICEAHNISFHVIGVLKKMKVITNDKWIYTYLPNWALAVDIQIAYWQIQAKQKKYKKEMFKKLELYGINKSILQRGDKLTEENDMLVIRNKGVIVSKYNKVSKKGEVFNRL